MQTTAITSAFEMHSDQITNKLFIEKNEIVDVKIINENNSKCNVS